MREAFLPMMTGGGMMPSGWDWGSMWLAWVLPSITAALIVILIVAFYLRREEPRNVAPLDPYFTKNTLGQANGTGLTPSSTAQSKIPVLAEVLRSLAPTLTDDERRVMDEMVKAGGEVLQSDLPRLTAFSKSTVSKAIQGLETRAILVREKHKWTYWCKVNPRLIERTLQEKKELQEIRPITS